jgi:hypothetical protein
MLIGRRRQEILGLRAWILEKQPRGSPVRFYHDPTIRIDTEDVREALSGLWEGDRGVFTDSTESSEIACVLHLKIPNVPTCGRDTRKRQVREEQEKEKEEGGPYPPSPRLLEGILVSLVWVYLYVYLDNAHTEGILYSLQK